MRLIDADALLEQYGDPYTDFIDGDDVRNAPTIDAVPVVRCKECKHGTIMKNYFGDEMVQCGCEKNPIGRWNDYERWLMPKGFYCADGERKDGEHEDKR